jgi:hypothetical protein
MTLSSHPFFFTTLLPNIILSCTRAFPSSCISSIGGSIATTRVFVFLKGKMVQVKNDTALPV